MMRRFLIFLLILSACSAQPPTGTAAPLSDAATNVEGKNIGFIAFGDWGTGSPQQKLVAEGIRTFCAEELCRFGILLGDNFYPNGVRNVEDPQWDNKFQKPYGSLGFVFYPTLGNHDYGGNVQAQVDYSKRSSLWKMPGRYFTFQAGDMELFAIDTERFDDAQGRWLKEKLERSTASWKMVYGHHPIYSYGSHGNTPGLVVKLLPILKGRADFYVCGHDHDKQVLTAEDGVSFVVAGAAAMTRPVKKGPKTLFAAETLGFSHWKIEDGKVRMRMLGAGGELEYERVYTKP